MSTEIDLQGIVNLVDNIPDVLWLDRYMNTYANIDFILFTENVKHNY